MKQRKIYISGQITGLKIYEYSTKFNKAELKLIVESIQRNKNEIKYNVINPIYIKPLFGIKKWFFYMVTDIWHLIQCNEIYMLNNWHNSRGAKIEHKIAKMLNFKITYQQ